MYTIWKSFDSLKRNLIKEVQSKRVSTISLFAVTSATSFSYTLTFFYLDIFICLVILCKYSLFCESVVFFMWIIYIIIQNCHWKTPMGECQ